MSRRALLPVALLVAVGLQIPAPAATAATVLPIDRLGDIVVDQAHGRVFMSGGPDSSRIVVTDLSGGNLRTVDVVGGANQMTLSADGSTLYAALTRGDAVAAVDTTSLAVEKIPTGAQSCPYDVAETAGKVWFSYGCSSAGNIGAIDTVTHAVVAGLMTTTYDGAHLLESSPGLPGRLAAHGDNALSILDVTGGETPTVETGPTIESQGDDLAVTPDGSRVITTSMSPYVHPVYLTADLSADGAYDTAPYPNAVAVRADGMVAAGSMGIYEPDVYVYEPGKRSVYRTYDFGTSSTARPYVQQGGLAFGANRLYAVTGDFDGHLALRVITPRRASSVTVTPSRTTYGHGATAKVTVRLKAVSATRTVSVYATPYGGTEKLLKRAQVSADGTLTAGLTVQRRTRFTVRYAGDAHTDPSSDSVSVAVRARVDTVIKRHYAKDGKYHLVHEGTVPLSVAKVSPNHAGDCLWFRAQFWVNGAWRYPATTDCARMDRYSRAAARLVGDYPVGLKVRMRAEWRGDKENAADNAAWRYLRFTR